MAGRVVHFSNRVDIPRPGQATAGGLDEAIAAPPGDIDVTRIGWSGRIIDDADYDPACAVSEATVDGVRYVTIDFSRTLHDGFYIGTANSFLWPLCHFRPDIAVPGFSVRDNALYNEANRLFAQVARLYVRPGDILIIHDYHLLPLGRELIRAGIHNPLGFFLHIPAPDAALLAQLEPELQAFVYDLLKALHAYDLVGVQARRDLEALGTIMPLDGADASPFNRRTRWGVMPVIGRTAQYVEDARLWAHRPETEHFLADKGPAHLVGVERLDYSKGIPNKFSALTVCHETGILMPEQAHFLQVAPFGRSGVPAYQREKARTERAYRRLTDQCGKVATLHMDKVLRQINLGIFRRSQVGLVTPLRDGMNLVAFEYLAAQDPADPGVLVLSKHAGAAEVLDGAAVSVDPNHPEDIARGIEKAMSLPLLVRQYMHGQGMKTMNAHTNAGWQSMLIEGAAEAAAHRPVAQDVPKP